MKDLILTVVYWIIRSLIWSILAAFVGVSYYLFGPIFTGCGVGIMAFAIWLRWETEKEELAAQEKAAEEARNFNPAPIHVSAHFATDEELEAAGCFKGGVTLGYSQESGHAISTPQNVHRMIWGTTGSGKSTSALMVDMLTWEQSMIIIDSTGELTVTTAHHRQKYGEVLIVNPMDMYLKELRGLKQVGINFLSPNRIVPGSNNFEIYAKKIANGIVRVDPTVHDKYWSNSARALLTAAIMTECRYNSTPSLARVAEVFSGDLTDYAKNMLQAGFDTNDKWLIDTWSRWGHAEAGQIKSLRDVVEHARTDIYPFTLPTVSRCLEHDGVDFRRCVHEPTTIYFMSPMEQIKELTPFLRLGAAHGTAQILSQCGSGKVRTKLIIDELYQVHAEELDYGLTANRKFGLDMTLCLNDVSQLRALYPQTFNSMIGSCGIFQVLNVNRDEETAEHVSKLCGEREVSTPSRSVNTNPLESATKLGVSDSNSMSTRRLLLPHEVRSLGPREQIMWVPGVNNPIRCDRRPYFEIPELAKRAKANPFYSKSM